MNIVIIATSLFSNPTTDFIQVKLDGDEVSNITLLDLRGNVIARTKTDARSAQLSLVGQPSRPLYPSCETGSKIQGAACDKKLVSRTAIDP